MNSINRSIMKVHNAELCCEVLGESLVHPKAEESLIKPTSPNRACKSPTSKSPTHTGRIPSRSSTSQAIRAVEWLSRKARRAVLALPDDPQLAHLKQTCEQISSEEYEFLSELSEYLAKVEGQDERKKAMLYKKWKERVFEPIHSQVNKKMDSDDYKLLDNEKRKLFDNYLTYSSKQEVFLETISAEEYDPNNTRQLKVMTSPLSDPLRAQNDDAELEGRIVEGCEEGIPLDSSPPGCGVDIERGNEAVLWLAMELVHIDSTNAKTRRQGMQGEHNKCSEGSEEGKLRIPHKKRVLSNNQQPLTLQWKQHN